MKRMSKTEETTVSEDQFVLSCVMSFGMNGAYYAWACAVTCTHAKLPL